MNIDFARSERSTIGTEWEVALVDRATGELTPAAPDLLNDLSGTDAEPRVEKELLTNTVEIISTPQRTVQGIVEQMGDVAAAVSRAATRRGVGVFCAGTHPFARAADQPYNRTPRYQKLIDRTQLWGRQMLIYGLHVHVGVDSRDKVIPMVRGMLNYLPHLIALSASSPWWEGVNTGYASNRTMVFQQLPTVGLPEDFTTWDEFAEYAASAQSVGMIDDVNEIRWDVRPSPKFGTIEVRICDGVPTLRELGALTAFIQCAADDLNQRLVDGQPIPRLKRWQIRENKWRASRYGLPTVFIRDADNAERPVIDSTLELIDRWEPLARRLGCAEQLADLDEIIRGGASYQRQLRVASQHDGDLHAVIDSLVDEFEER